MYKNKYFFFSAKKGGLLIDKKYGVFFSKDLKSKNNEPTIASETLKLEIEMAAKIEGIKLLNIPYVACEVNHSKVSWRDLLIIYAIKTNGGNNQQQVMTLDKKKVKVLYTVYWDMNEIKWHKSLDKEKLIMLQLILEENLHKN